MNTPLPQNKRILFAVLNWGLGHASRSIPLIQKLLDKSNEILIASDGEALVLLKKEFPENPVVSLSPYRVRYTDKLWSIVLKNIPNIAWAILCENRQLRQLQQSFKPDLVISDSRFGFYSRKIPCCIISHQLSLQSPNKFIGAFINRINSYFLNRFDEVWIPDAPDRRLSGQLSQNPRIKNTRFIGILSRMKNLSSTKVYDLSVILSGPEPSRSLLEHKLLAVLNDLPLRVCFVRGTNHGEPLSFPESWEVFKLLGSNKLNEILCASKQVVSRSGYSSVMDYYCTGTRAILVPTPGQTEQEYLGKALNGMYGLVSLEEQSISQLRKSLDI